MRRWNGWGDESNEFPLKETARQYLVEQLGPASPLPDATLESVIAKVPESRLPAHPLIAVDAETRIRHARGQSLPDWLAMRSGAMDPFPDGVAFPTTDDQVRELLAFAREQGITVIPYGGGTSVVGHISPEVSDKPVLTIAMSKMKSLIDLDPQSQIATLGAGVPGPELEAQLNAKGYTLGHFPQSFELSTLGGWVASRSSGQQSLRYGRIEQLFAGANVETPQGPLEIPAIPASSAGPDLREMILGSEGRMGIIINVKVRVNRVAEDESFHVAFLPDWDSGVAAIRALTQQKIPVSLLRLSNPIETFTQLKLAGSPMAVDALNRVLSLRGVGKDKVMLTFGLTGTKSHCRHTLRLVKATLKPFKAVQTGTLLGKKWEHARFRSPYLRHGLWEHGYAVDTLETAVNWQNIKTTVRDIESSLHETARALGEQAHVFTHLSHVYGQGASVYTTYIFRCAQNYSETLERWKLFKAASSEAVVQNGGTISHQHGVGRDHAPYLVHEKGELGLSAIGQLCEHFDPTGMMNPGKLLPNESENNPLTLNEQTEKKNNDARNQEAERSELV